ncbi:flavodoxin domain-containing protein [Pseudarthrobacter oxydans]|uniref:flavodoxin domain-containing protein n=1 Tax=Pseudarthrobacter oxydans TaxID=1671 RepID=UPI0031B62C16
MRILVAYATRHGATAGIAERLASRFAEGGIPAEAHPVTAVDDVALYDAVVLGGAAYMGHWLKEATASPNGTGRSCRTGRSGSSAAARSETTPSTKPARMSCTVRGPRSSPN